MAMTKASLDTLTALLQKLPKEKWVVDDNASPVIYAGEMRICDIRGWGYLTGHGSGSLGLPPDTARDIQIDVAQFIADMRNNAEALIVAARESSSRIAELEAMLAGLGKKATKFEDAREYNASLVEERDRIIADGWAALEAAKRRIARMEEAFYEIDQGSWHHCREVAREMLAGSSPERVAELRLAENDGG